MTRAQCYESLACAISGWLFLPRRNQGTSSKIYQILVNLLAESITNDSGTDSSATWLLFRYFRSVHNCGKSAGTMDICQVHAPEEFCDL